MMWPNGTNTQPRVSSPYGPRKGGYSNFHEGVDFIGYNDIVAILPGKVTWAARYNSAAGNAVVYVPDGFPTVEIKHFHIAGWNVYKGQRVGQGQKIATMGQTGNATGKCDHFEIRVNGVRVDPIAWVNANTGGAGKRDEATAQRQAWLVSRGWNLAVDGIEGPKTRQAYKEYQSQLRDMGLYKGAIDGIWGNGTQAAHDVFWGRVNAPVNASQPVTYASIQAGLNKFGYGLTVDGVWGPKSSAALADFQRKHGLVVDRIVGPKTRAALGI